MRLSLKLGALCAAAAIVPVIIIFTIVSSQVSSRARETAVEQLRADARAAGSLCDKRLTEMRAYAQELADEIANRALVSGQNLDRNNPSAWARLQDLLPRAQNESALDFVVVTDPLGRVIARQNDRPAPGETLLGAEDKNPVAERVIAGGNLPIAACVIERGERYARLGLDRIAQVQLQDGSSVDEALMVEAAAPIFSAGRLVGLVLIGQMLNTYYKPRSSTNPLQTPLVAEAKQILFREGEENSGAVIALGKAIVASSVPPDATTSQSREPALTGVSHNLTRQEETITASERDYIVAWQPLKSLDGSVIASIGVARTASETSDAARSVRGTLALIGAIFLLLAGGAGFLLGQSLASRIELLTQTANRWGLGELSTPARDSNTFLTKWIPLQFLRDEITDLAEQLDQTRESFRQAIERMRKR
jgi:hypothetical protein